MAIRHKRARLEQTKSDRAYRFLGLHTEQDVVETTRDLAVAEKPILRAHRKVRGVGGVVDVFSGRRRRSSSTPTSAWTG